MAARTFRRRAAGILAAVLPGSAVRWLRQRLARWFRVPGADEGLVSIVLVCEPVDVPRLPEALASALTQSHRHLEVLLCPVDRAAGLIAPAVAQVQDVRVRVRADEPTWAEAATAGALVAHGDYLLFLRGCDRLPPDAVSGAVSALALSGADLATGPLEQAGAPEPWLLRAQRDAHRAAGGPVVPSEHPELAGDLAIGNKLLRRTAWLAGSGRFSPDDDWIRSAAIAGLLVRASTVHVLDQPMSVFAPDHGTRAYGATPSSLPDLPRWRRAVAAVEAVFGDSELTTGWVRHVASHELPRFLTDAERASDAEWTELRELARHYLAAAGPEQVPVAARTLLTLTAEDRRLDVLGLAAEVAALGEDLRTVVRGDRIVAQWQTPGLSLPEDLCCLSEAETRLLVHVPRIQTGPGGQEVDLFLSVDFVDLGVHPVEVVVHTTDGVALPSATLPHAEATRWFGRRFHRATAVQVRFAGHQPTELVITLRTGELTRSTQLLVSVPTTRLLSGRSRAEVVTVHDLALADGDLVVVASGPVARLQVLDPQGRALDLPLQPTPTGVRIRLQHELFGTPTWLGPGAHRLVCRPERTGEPENVLVVEELPGRLPLEMVGEQHRVRAYLGPRGGLVLGLGPPLTDDELGPYAQEQLHQHYLRNRSRVEPDLYYFESYAGRTATDSPLAIFSELRWRDPDLRAYWGISDHSQSVPEGAIPVLRKSAQWYDVLARAGCLVLNTDVEEGFRRRLGQFLLQTFHGYPAKAMGEAQWRALDHSPSLVRRLRARGVDTWSAILTPSPVMTRHYREQYGYHGLALEYGYPRDDALVSPPAGRRERVRDLLGIGEHQRAVLYAPTWREHLATRPRAAVLTDYLDVTAAAAALGEQYVLLLRGHRFHAPQAGGPRVLDVTAYPEINDLILASDAAVLDYSSLRFDYALTGKPMVFLVPDLAEYEGGTRSFLFPFTDSAPGPLVTDTAGVVGELRDLEALTERYAGDVAHFVATYQSWQDGQAAARVVDGLLSAGLASLD